MLYFYLFGVWFVFSSVVCALKPVQNYDIKFAFILSLFSWLVILSFLWWFYFYDEKYSRCG